MWTPVWLLTWCDVAFTGIVAYQCGYCLDEGSVGTCMAVHQRCMVRSLGTGYGDMFN